MKVIRNFSKNVLSNSMMVHCAYRILTIIFLLAFTCLSQARISESKLFAELAEDEKRVAECEQKSRDYQIAKFGRVLPKISGHCWDGCATRIVLPYYPNEARRLRISGQVRVETVVNEDGKVIYAKVTKGKPFLSQVAFRAAYLSTYTPKKACDDKPIKFRWTIVYNFFS